MIDCRPGEIVLVRFPFTDTTASKQRPALVLSPAEYPGLNGDVVLLALTSQPRSGHPCLQQWRSSGLLLPTWLEPLLATIAASLVTSRLGELHHDDVPAVRQALRTLVAPEWLTEPGLSV